MEAAAHWLVRHDMGDMPEEERKQFSEWIQDDENAAAFQRAQAQWDVLPDVRDDPLVKALRQSALRTPRAGRMRWLVAGGGLAACIAVAALFLFAGFPRIALLERGTGLEMAGEADFVTGLGERRNVMLPDGTVVVLNTDTAIDVAFVRDRRLVRLIRGQAFFDVAPDPGRPFTVDLADRRVTAAGTTFDVRLAADHMHVVLVDGAITIHRHGTEESRPGLVLQPGQKLREEFGGLASISSVDVERLMLWREGFIEFENSTIEDAVAEMNRYTDRPVRILDRRVGEMRVSGVFRTEQTENFVSTVSEILPVAADNSRPDRIGLIYSDRRLGR